MGWVSGLRPDCAEGPRLAACSDGCRYPEPVADVREIEFVFEPQEEGGYHVYAPDLPGLHTQGDSLEEATENAREALELYVEGLRDEGRSLDTGIVRRKLPLPA
jgi:predicted RNase H-like HicB family nuclease